MPDTKKLWLTRTVAGRAQRDLVTFRLPSLPERLALNEARRHGFGWRDGDDDRPANAAADWEARPSGPVCSEDLLACQWAAVALCAPAGLVGCAFPRLRDHGRDVVAFGEAVATVLWNAGYRTLKEPLGAGVELIEWISAETWGEEEAIAEEAKGFPSAPAPASASGAPSSG